MLSSLNIEIVAFLNDFAVRYPQIAAFYEAIGVHLGWLIVGGSVVVLLYNIVRWYRFKDQYARTIARFLIEVGVLVWSAHAVTSFLKYIIHYPRPFVAFGDIVPVFLYGGFDSFPSGHATVFAAFAAALWGYVPQWWGRALLFVGAILIPLSRVGAGIHYPLDIVMGWIVGVCVVVLSRKMLYTSRFKLS